MGMAVELGKHGIRVNAVGPSYVHAEQNFDLIRTWTDGLPCLHASQGFRFFHSRLDQLTDQVAADAIELDAVLVFGRLCAWFVEIKYHCTPSEPQRVRPLIEAMQEEVESWFNLAESVEVEGDLFHLRGVYRMVLRSINYVQYPGKPRVHGYQLECESDAPLELIIQ